MSVYAGNKGSFNKAQFCVKHGGGTPCSIEGCTRTSRGPTGMCYKHKRVSRLFSLMAIVSFVLFSILLPLSFIAPVSSLFPPLTFFRSLSLFLFLSHAAQETAAVGI